MLPISKVSAAVAMLGLGLLARAQSPVTAQVSPKRIANVQDPAAVDRGHKTFESNCAFCHGGSAKGGESGPDLLRSVTVLDDEGGDKIGPVVHGSRVDKGMPKFPLTDAQISDISAFLHDRVHAAAQRGSYKILNIVTGDPKKGDAYFHGAGGCAGCHSVDGDLAHIGSKFDAVNLQQKIIMPREWRGRRNPGAIPNKQLTTVDITLASGEKVTGSLVALDDFYIGIRDQNGDYRSFTRKGNVPKLEIHDPLKAHTDMLTKYTDADIHNLTAYLVNVK